MGRPGRNGQKAIRVAEQCLGEQSGLEIWLCGCSAINETALRISLDEAIEAGGIITPANEVSPAA